jgi:hypothetical protein
VDDVCLVDVVVREVIQPIHHTRGKLFVCLSGFSSKTVNRTDVVAPLLVIDLVPSLMLVPRRVLSLRKITDQDFRIPRVFSVQVLQGNDCLRLVWY